MIYLLLSSISAYMGTAAGLGASLFLRPVLDAVSPLSPASVAMVSSIAALTAALVSAFFALSKPLPLDHDELLLLAASGVLGGALGDLLSARFIAMLSPGGAVLLQNALYFVLVALPAVYFSTLSRNIRPLAITRLAALPVAFLISIFAGFLAFGAEPVSIAAYYLLFDADDDEASGAALTIALSAMIGKLLTALIRQRFSIADGGILLWLLPGAVLGTAAAVLLPAYKNRMTISSTVLKMSLFTALICMSSSLT